MKRVRLTRSGVGLLVGSIGLVVFALLLRYREIGLLGAIGLILVAVAATRPRPAPGFYLKRTLSRPMFQRGEPFELRHKIRAPRPLPATQFLDLIAAVPIVLDVPALAANQIHEETHRVALDRRGVHMVGPLVEERRDWFGLAARRSLHSLTSEILVHAVIHPLGKSYEQARLHLQAKPTQRITDDPLSEFRALREYQPGDDPRLIHWASTARTGTLEVRDFLSIGQPEWVVILESNDRSMTPLEFEEAVEIAASVAVHGLENRLITHLRTDAPWPEDQKSSKRMRPLRSLAEVQEMSARVCQVPSTSARSGRDVLRGGQGPGQIFLVTGARSTILTDLAQSPGARRQLTVIRVSDRPQLLPVVGSPCIDVQSGSQFARVWKAKARF